VAVAVVVARVRVKLETLVVLGVAVVMVLVLVVRVIPPLQVLLKETLEAQVRLNLERTAQVAVVELLPLAQQAQPLLVVQVEMVLPLLFLEHQLITLVAVAVETKPMLIA
jgi:hypothetical protein